MPLTVFYPFFHRFVDQTGKGNKENWCLHCWRSCNRYHTTNFFRLIRWCWNRTRNKRRKQDVDWKRLLKSHPQRLLWSAQTIWRYAPGRQPRSQGFSSSPPRSREEELPRRMSRFSRNFFVTAYWVSCYFKSSLFVCTVFCCLFCRIPARNL